ncbi:MAG: CoA transferase [Dehalococcoidia bacterium]
MNEDGGGSPARGATGQAGPLEGVRVLDLTHYVAGPYCTRVLADQGAAVLRIEPPGGDPLRSWPPFPPGGQEPGLLYTYLNCDKELITLDLSDPAARERVLDLARNSDVVVENFRPGTLDRWGIGWEALHRANPRLVLTSISNFGQTGPYRDYRAWDIVEDALGGLAYIHGADDRQPLTHGNPQAQYRAGVVATSATIAALLNVDDEGEHVDVSIMECIASTLRDTIPQYTFMGAVRRRGGRQGGAGAITRCADGWVIPSAYGADYSLFANFLEAPELGDEKFLTGDGRQTHAAEFRQTMVEVLKRWKTMEFFEGAQTWGFGVGAVISPLQNLDSSQLRERGFFRDIEVSPGQTAPAPKGGIRI